MANTENWDVYEWLRHCDFYQEFTLASCRLSRFTSVFWLRLMYSQSECDNSVGTSYIDPLAHNLCCATYQNTSFSCLTLYRTMHSVLPKHKQTWQCWESVINFFYISTCMWLVCVCVCEDSFRMKTWFQNVPIKSPGRVGSLTLTHDKIMSKGNWNWRHSAIVSSVTLTHTQECRIMQVILS